MNTLKVGDKAPEFQVLNQNENLVQSSDLKGKAYILFFYPEQVPQDVLPKHAV